jgi:hypothetical protein
MKIDIPNPCHEDWNTMTPTEKGAFCGVCKKEVVDFSGKKISAIKNYFSEKKSDEKTCARIENSQLVQLGFDGFFARFRLWNLVRRTAVILFFSFGATLFSVGLSSCNNTTEGEVERVGKVAVQDTSDNAIQADSNHANVKGKIQVSDTTKSK